MRLLYIDPGTGSMLFTVLIGLIGAAVYSIRMLLMKLRYRLKGGKAEIQKQKIPFVIYSDDKRYWSVFEPICREMKKREKSVLYLTASNDDPAFKSDLDNITVNCIGKENSSFAKLNFLNATILLSTTPGLDVYQWKRSKGVNCYIHILHAAAEATMYRMFGIDYYDAIMVSGDYQIDDIRNLETLRNLPSKELVKIGIPYMDEMAKRLKLAGPVPKHQKTVLVAPTWGKSGLFSVYGGKILDLLLKEDYHIIVRPHPQSFESEKEMIDALMKQYPESDRIEWNRDTDNFEVLRRSDILISDFSGVIFDFALVYDKPVIYTDPKFDNGVYDAWWLDTPFWTTTALPRLGEQITEENINNLKDLIESCLNDLRFAEGRKQVKEETWVHFGEGATRAVDFILNKYDEITNQNEEKQ